MKVIYLHHLPFPWGRAHDVHVIKTVYYLAREGLPTLLLAPLKKAFRRPEALLKYYGLGPPPEKLKIVPIPVLRIRRPFKLAVNSIYDLFLRLYLRRHPPSEGSLFLFSEARLVRLALRLAPEVPRILEIHGLRYFKKGGPCPEEKKVFEALSLGLITTRALKELIQEIYAPSVPLEHLPLASEPLTDTISRDKNHPPLMVYAGQLYPGQGVEVVLEALKYLPAARLVVIGGRKKDLDRLQRLSRALNLSSRVKFTGYLPPAQVRSWLLKADLLVLPALPEGKQPYVAHQKLYEYLGAGRPVLASNLPSVREEIEEGEALLFEPGNPEDLAQKAQIVLGNEDLAQKLAHKALKRAQYFDWPARTRRMLKILKGYGYG
ncbi:glycosyltransferase [Thermosulfurimonas marina]|uniref:Glycosyltransferase n=1 Tax=Thermosulfurimonas marina TaxID=2047767 RepID=A0A6H1WT05_9BACT|nr:glycosyltransferase [Thermosulfurimonas marina]QJA06284.1 glycosyltransferase [Thermosulfurimonas marina]